MILLFVAAVTAMSPIELILIVDATKMCDSPVDWLDLSTANQCHTLFCHDVWPDWLEVVNKTFIAELCPRLTDNWRFDGIRLLKSDVPPKTLRRWRRWVGTEDARHPLTPRADIFMPEALNREQTSRWIKYVAAAEAQWSGLMPITAEILTGIEYRAKLRNEQVKVAPKKLGWANRVFDYLVGVDDHMGAPKRIDDLRCDAVDENLLLQYTVCWRRAHTRGTEFLLAWFRDVMREITLATRAEGESAEATEEKARRSIALYEKPLLLTVAITRLSINTMFSLSIALASTGDERFNATSFNIDMNEHVYAEMQAFGVNFGACLDAIPLIAIGVLRWIFNMHYFCATTAAWLAFKLVQTSLYLAWCVVHQFVSVVLFVAIEAVRSVAMLTFLVGAAGFLACLVDKRYFEYLLATAAEADQWDVAPAWLRRILRRHWMNRAPLCRCLGCIPDARIDDVPIDNHLPASGAKGEVSPPAVQAPVDVNLTAALGELRAAASPTPDTDMPALEPVPPTDYPSRSAVVRGVAALYVSRAESTPSLSAPSIAPKRTEAPNSVSFHITRREQLCSVMHSMNIAFRNAAAEFKTLPLERENLADRRDELNRTMNSADYALCAALREYEAIEATEKK
jgi:hypothetical protein